MTSTLLHTFKKFILADIQDFRMKFPHEGNFSSSPKREGDFIFRKGIFLFREGDSTETISRAKS
jgi:hypothetical protein